MSDTTPPKGPRDELVDVLAQLGDDEVRTMLFLGRRLLERQRAYGRIDIVGDPRDFMTERRAEIGDLLVYTAFQQLRRELANGL